MITIFSKYNSSVSFVNYHFTSSKKKKEKEGNVNIKI